MLLLNHISLLEELDEELLVELDETVRQNQLALQPFAKSGRAEADLLEQHADLAGALAQARERKIDSMGLRSRLHEDEERSASLNKFRVGSWGRTSSFPAKDQTSRTPPKQSLSPALSPALLAQDVGSELLFEMDEEKAEGKRCREHSSYCDIALLALPLAFRIECMNAKCGEDARQKEADNGRYAEEKCPRCPREANVSKTMARETLASQYHKIAHEASGERNKGARQVRVAHKGIVQ